MKKEDETNPAVPPPQAPAASKGPNKPEDVGRKAKAFRPKPSAAPAAQDPATVEPAAPSAPGLARSVFDELWNL